MKTKRLFILVLIGVFAVLSIGCAPKKNQKSRISSRAARGGEVAGSVNTVPGTGGTAPSTSNKQWGEIVQISNINFQMHVESFLSNMAEEDGTQLKIGTVSGVSGQNTGVRFWGAVQLAQGLLNRNGGNNAQVSSQGSALRISIIDNYVGQVNAQGENITEVPVYIASNVSGFVGVTGSVTGNQATITFQDSFGKITLQGTFNAQWFSGYVIYDNDFYWNGVKPGAAGYLGTFYVPTCGFFSCQ